MCNDLLYCFWCTKVHVHQFLDFFATYSVLNDEV